MPAGSTVQKGNSRENKGGHTGALRTSLVVQWLRLQAPNAGSLGGISGQGTRSHIMQLGPDTAKHTKILKVLKIFKKDRPHLRAMTYIMIMTWEHILGKNVFGRTEF